MNLLLFQTWTQEQMQAQIDAAPWGWTVHAVTPTMWLVIGVALLATLWSIFNMFKNPAGIKKLGFGFLALLILFVLGYFVFSTGNVPDNLKDMVSPSVFHWVGAGMFMTAVLIGIGFLILLLDLIRGIFKI